MIHMELSELESLVGDGTSKVDYSRGRPMILHEEYCAKMVAGKLPKEVNNYDQYFDYVMTHADTLRIRTEEK